MIIKELDPFFGKTSWDFTGRKAEEEMAFKLNRRFHNNQEFHVINNLRFDWLGSHVQIDHLVLCRYGAIIIESKSVRSKVKYEGEEWFRLWDNHWTGMKNPVIQAEEQAHALKELLCQNNDKIFSKSASVTIAKNFLDLPIHCFVAISDLATIYRPKENDCYKEQVFKAEVITNKIESFYDELKQNMSFIMTNDELNHVEELLLSVHVPYIPETLPEASSSKVHTSSAANPQVNEQPAKAKTEPSTAKNAKKTEKTAPTPQKSKSKDEEEILTYDKCPQCGGKISILWGAKFKSYYWHCDACGKNISINYKCPKCHEKLRIKKNGHDFFIYCEPCGLQELYFTEKEE